MKKYEVVVVQKKLLQLESWGFERGLLYNTYTTREITDAYIHQATASWTAIKTAIACEIAEGHDYNFEGHQLQPKLVHELLVNYSSIEIKMIFLVKRSVSLIAEGLQKNSAKNDWAIQKTANPETYIKIAKMVSEYSTFFEQEAH